MIITTFLFIHHQRKWTVPFAQYILLMSHLSQLELESTDNAYLF